MKKLDSISAILFFSFITLIIVFPLLSPGFIITLDIPATDKVITPNIFSNDFLLTGVFYLLHFLVPNYIIQKVVIALALFLSGWGMYSLVPVKSKLIKAFAGFIYMVNPFTYERLVSGQWLLILGFAMLPIVISQTLKFFREPTQLRIISLTLLITILANISPHFLFISGLFILIYLSVYIFLSAEKSSHLFSGGGKVLFLSLILNVNWLIGLLLNKSMIGSAIATFDQSDLMAFQSVPDKSFGILYNLLSGYGFWAEANNYFISAKSLFPFWWVITPILLSFALYGFYICLIKRKEYVISITLGIFFLISLDFAAGIALKNFAPIALFLYQKIPLLRGFREPQKLVSVIILFLAYFGSLGLEFVLDRLGGSRKHFIRIGVFILPVILTLPIFWGFWGQLRPVWYPQSWSETNKLLSDDKDDFITLFFPWHQYMRFKFANNLVTASPAKFYFDKPILSSSNYETVYLNLRDTKSETLHVEGLLSIEKEGKNLLGDRVSQKFNWGESLAPIGVKYIILAKDDDWKDYRFLDKSSDLKKIIEKDDLSLYENLSWRKETLIEEPQNFEELPFIPIDEN